MDEMRLKSEPQQRKDQHEHDTSQQIPRCGLWSYAFQPFVFSCPSQALFDQGCPVFFRFRIDGSIDGFDESRSGQEKLFSFFLSGTYHRLKHIVHSLHIHSHPEMHFCGKPCWLHWPYHAVRDVMPAPVISIKDQLFHLLHFLQQSNCPPSMITGAV